MPRYLIEFDETVRHRVVIEAADEDEAREAFWVDGVNHAEATGAEGTEIDGITALADDADPRLPVVRAAEVFGRFEEADR